MTDSSLPLVGTDCPLTIRDLTIEGGALARTDSGAVIFLDRGLPGEEVLARIESTSSRFARATVLQTLRSSPDAVPAPCPYFGTCGGCAWQDLAYPAQLAWKNRQARETLRRLGRIDPESVTWEPTDGIPSPRPYGYRNKVEFAFGVDEAGKPALGLRRRGSRAIIPVADCLLCRDSVAPILEATRTWLRETGLDHEPACSSLRHLVLRMPDEKDKDRAVTLAEIITYPTSRSSDLGRQVRELFSRLRDVGVSGCAHSSRRDKAAVAYGENLIYTEGYKTMREKFGDILLDAPVQAFLQVNTGAATDLYAAIRRMAALKGSEQVLDCYSGVGGIALSLAPDALFVHGMESVPAAVRQAKSNAARNRTANCRFTAGPLAEQLAAHTDTPDLVVLDPPRSGMGNEVITALLRLEAPRIISVSCDPASQARDLAALAPRYRVRGGCVTDLFPHTPHFETAYLLERV